MEEGRVEDRGKGKRGGWRVEDRGRHKGGEGGQQYRKMKEKSKAGDRIGRERGTGRKNGSFC